MEQFMEKEELNFEQFVQASYFDMVIIEAK